MQLEERTPMEIRVQFPRERTQPAGTVRAARPAADRQVDPGEGASDRRQNDGRQQQQPSADADSGGHVVDKTA
jgi:hypothetical protein